MSEEYGRVWRLRVDDVDWSDLDLRVTARHPEGTTDLTIYHPDPRIVQGVGRRALVEVVAGYDQAGGAVTIGGGIPVLDSIDYDRSSVDMPLTVQLSSARVAAEAVLSASWQTISAKDLLRYVAREAGLTLDDQTTADVLYARGYALSGGVQTVIADIAEDLHARYALDGVTLRVWPRDGVLRPTAIVWAPDTGLMRASESGGQVRASATLTPGLRPGHLVRLSSDGYEGDVRVVQVTHEIDTQGDTWMTSLTGVPRG